jgi:invasion protein IalB
MNRIRLMIAAPLVAAAMFVVPVRVDAQQPATAAKPAPAKKSAARPAPAAQTPAAPAVGVQPTLLGQYGDWGAYAAMPAGKKVCFAIARPASSQTSPPNRPRDPPYLFVASRPAEKVKDEVSVIIGYGFKPNSDATLDLAGAQYAMYTQNDGAWVKNVAEESRLVDSMRKGSDVTVKGTSAKGTATTDVFSLKGLSQALDRVGQECR